MIERSESSFMATMRSFFIKFFNPVLLVPSRIGPYFIQKLFMKSFPASILLYVQQICCCERDLYLFFFFMLKTVDSVFRSCKSNPASRCTVILFGAMRG